MTPDMSVNAMVDSFIYIVKGSRVIDRNCGADWRTLRWMKESYAKSHVLSMTDLRTYFSHRRGKWKDPVDDWFKHKFRFTAATLSEAMKIADEAARGLIEVRIDVDAIIAADKWRKGETCPPWERSRVVSLAKAG